MALPQNQLNEPVNLLSMGVSRGMEGCGNCVGDDLMSPKPATMDLLGIDLQKAHDGLGNCIVDDLQKKG